MLDIDEHMTESEMTRNYEKNLAKLAERSNKCKKELEEIEWDTVVRYKGLTTTLEAALGMLRMGDHLGWKALTIIHSRRTLRKYERILGLVFENFSRPKGQARIEILDIWPPRGLRTFGRR